MHLFDPVYVTWAREGAPPRGTGCEGDVAFDELLNELGVLDAVDAVVYPVRLEEFDTRPDVLDRVLLVDVAVGRDSVTLLLCLLVDLCSLACGVVLFVVVQSRAREV